METREQRGIIIAALTKLTRRESDWYVPSQSKSETLYIVNIEKGTCSCPDHRETGFKCKHQWAVEFTLKREHHADGTVVEQQTFKWREEKKCTQNWATYNEAQSTERTRFQELLFDLCCGLQEPPRKSLKGRPRYSLRDRVFSSVFKVYSTLSSRRFGSDLTDAHAKGYTDREVHFNAVNFFLEEPELTPVFKSLVVRSAAPLRAIETKFAVDSSGVTTSHYHKWFDHKYGVERTAHDWIKVHLACGVQTNIVTAAAIYDRDANDSPILPELVKTTAGTFQLAEVSADKGYLSVENVETIFDAGATPFIAPKVNTTGAAGGLFEKMFHYYQFNREEYMDRYHLRSNVESTFSMIKRKFGDNVRSKTQTAMRNEVYCKLISHNVCVVHESAIDLGIEPVFWPGAATDGPAILPLLRK